MIRRGQGEPVVLIHGVTGSSAVWASTVDRLATSFDVIAIDLLGHAGGTPTVPGTTTRISDIVDDAAHRLDELGLDRAHLVGNSLGGWVALELARRGRARSVCAFSPAGCWDPPGENAGGSPDARAIAEGVATTRRTRPLLPLLARVQALRRTMMRGVSRHGERINPREVVRMADDLLACTVVDDVLNTREYLAPLDPLPCPVTLAWGEHDWIFPPSQSAPRARVLLPGATLLELPGLGHVPIFDGPVGLEVVERTVRDTIAASTRAG